jgi:hypothetical protein
MIFFKKIKIKILGMATANLSSRFGDGESPHSRMGAARPPHLAGLGVAPHPQTSHMGWPGHTHGQRGWLQMAKREAVAAHNFFFFLLKKISFLFFF